MRPTLEVFSTMYNNESAVKEFIEFYRNRIPDCIFTLHDNQSSDRTVEIAKDLGAKVYSFDTGGKIDEQSLINLRNNAWKLSNALNIITCDSDEFVTVTPELLECEDWNVCKCRGIELFNEKWLPIEEYDFGLPSEGYSKSVLWKKDAIKEMNFAPGSHTCSPTPNYGIELKWCNNSPFLIHGKWRGKNEGLQRQHELKAKGRSDHSKQRQWNWHYEVDDNMHNSYFDNGIRNSIKFK